jgi:hypothetical protein
VKPKTISKCGKILILDLAILKNEKEFTTKDLLN